MNIVKTATIVIALLLVISLISFFIPYDKIIGYIPYLNDVYNNTSLNINSKNGKATVTINGKGYGETPVSISNLPAGEYDIEIERVSDTTDFYQKKEVRITLERGTEAIIDLEIAPGGITSGYILYYTKSFQASNNSGYITMASNPADTSVYLDNEILQKTPVNAVALNAKNYEVKVQKEGYEELKFPIIIRNGYNLNIQISLYPLPTTLTK